MPKPASWTRRHPLVSYFVLAFAIAWILLLPLAAGALGRWPYRISQFWHFLGGLGPLLAAWIVTGTSLGKAGLAEFTGDWRRVSAFWLGVADLSPLLLFLAAALGLRLEGEPGPTLASWRTRSLPTPGGSWVPFFPPSSMALARKRAGGGSRSQGCKRVAELWPLRSFWRSSGHSGTPRCSCTASI